MTPEQFSKNLFKVYYHVNEIEALLTGMPLIKYLTDPDLTLMLESQKTRMKQLRACYDKVFGDISAQYGDDFDKLNELLDEHMQIQITV